MSKPKNSTGILPVCIPDDEARRMAMQSPAITELVRHGHQVPIPVDVYLDAWYQDCEIDAEVDAEVHQLVEAGILKP